jgi:hypothetical protein
MEELYTCICRSQEFSIYVNRIKCIRCGKIYAHKVTIPPTMFNRIIRENILKEVNNK